MSSPASGSFAEIDRIAVRYRNGAMGIHDVSMRIGLGEIVALCGPNGAGKTTTVRALTGLLKTEGTRVVAGSVTVDGKTVTNWEPHVLSKLGVHLIPERRKVFANLSVLENLQCLGHLPPKSERTQRLEMILEIFPALTDRMREKAGRLSGGQQQMLALARALMVDARLLVIDELALGLHPSLLQPLFASIRTIVGAERAAVIVNEDVRASPEFADRYYVLRDGKVGESGSTQEIEPAGVAG